MNIDFSKFPNPYDFANPVKRKELLFGREMQLKDINYYIDEAVKSKRPINLAFVGDRASGKTSLLNITEEVAKTKGCITTRMNLDESDIRSEFKFFQKLFSSVFYSIVKNGFYNGMSGTTYKTYEDMVYYGKEPADPTFCPCHFPSLMMRVIQNGFEVPVQDHVLESDFFELFNETKQPIVILIDECDVLSGNRTILQKLRNIFMNLDGYMLVFASTPRLFPELDEVFSPIIRQFKKIEVGRFVSTSDTEDCIIQPLKALNIDYKEILDFKSYIEIKKIHEICSGKPYEIQLICHFMFKRVQLGLTNSMTLNLSVLEDVRAELEKAQDINSRPILKAVQNFSKKQLNGLSLLSPGNNLLSFDKVWQIQSVTRKLIPFTRDELFTFFSEFISLKIFSLKDDLYCFLGDDFDKLYIKYFAQEKGVAVFFDIRDPGLLIHLNFTNRKSYFNSEVHFMSSFSQERASDQFENFKKELDRKEINIRGFFEDMYWALFDCQGASSYMFKSISLAFEWTYYRTYVYCKNISTIFEDETSYLNLQARVSDSNGELCVSDFNLDEIDFQIVHDTMMKMTTIDFKEEIVTEHFTRVVDCYFRKDYDRVKKHCDVLLSTHGRIKFSADQCNNFAYILLNKGDDVNAYKILEAYIDSISEYTVDLVHYLINYNFLVAKYKVDGVFELEKAQSLINGIEELTEMERKLAVLNFFRFEPINGIYLEEVFDPDLLDAYNEYIKIAESVVGN